MISYSQFKTCILSHFQVLYPEAAISVQSILKNNGVRKDAIHMQENDRSYAPVLYLDDLYELYKKNENMQEICHVLQLSFDSSADNAPEIATGITSFDYVREHLLCKLISREKNTDLLKKVPWKPVLDLALVYYIAARYQDTWSGLLITREFLQNWDISRDTLLQTAAEKVPALFPAKISSISDMIRDLPPEAENAIPIYVLSNSAGYFGASALLYPGVIDAFADQIDTDLYIIPSSVHEMLLISGKAFPNGVDFSPLIRDVNRTELKPEEVLTDHAYYYSRSERKISIL